MSVVTPGVAVERALLTDHTVVIACDEVGRGALAGPVAVGAVVVDAACAGGPVPDGLRDSKLVTERRRPDVARRAAAWVVASAVGWASPGEIDEIGIIRALGLAAVRAIGGVRSAGIATDGAVVILDGNHDYITPAGLEGVAVRPIVKADRDCASAAAASVIAKVARDELMVTYDAEYPAYGWARNKGYASAAHRDALRAYGVTPHHRASWALTGAPALF